MTTPSGLEPSSGTSAVSGPLLEEGSSEKITNLHQGEAVTTAGVNMPVLRIVGSLPDPVAEVAKILHTTSWDDQTSHASLFLNFLDRTAPAILRLNEGNQVHVALVNVTKTHPVKLVHCVDVGYSPIGATPTQVDGEILFLHQDRNQEFKPPQPLCLTSSMVTRNTVAVMT